MSIKDKIIQKKMVKLNCFTVRKRSQQSCLIRMEAGATKHRHPHAACGTKCRLTIWPQTQFFHSFLRKLPEMVVDNEFNPFTFP